jgi:hypothetical protein
MKCANCPKKAVGFVKVSSPMAHLFSDGRPYLELCKEHLKEALRSPSFKQISREEYKTWQIVES